MTRAKKISIKEQIAKANEKFTALFHGADFERLSQLYTTDAVLMPPETDMIIGRQRIAAFWKSTWESGVKKASLVTDELTESGNLAAEIGHYTMYSAEGQILDEGDYSVVWKHENGEWLLAHDLINSCKPAP
jgi:ketosteroid isomerase-like protein